MMINFRNDYNDIAHEAILDLLLEVKDQSNIGYGEDVITDKAKQLLQTHFDHKIYTSFMVGGTITNKTVISHLLKPYEAVISASTGHIDVHETGAIEQTGHKIITIDSVDGKINASDVKITLEQFQDFHRVIPKMIYLSNATETGLIYNKSELIELYTVAKQNDLILFIDGARLGVALTSKESDLTLNEISLYSDIFYIGGTKNGAMLGEAIITKHEAMHNNLTYSIKQNGGLLAKGFILGIQFQALFTNNLFFEIASKANQNANLLVEGLKQLRIDFKPTPTNQQFLRLKKSIVDSLKKNYQFEIWADHDAEQTIRLVTTYRRNEAEIQSFLRDLSKLI